ncbi:MAG: Bax inhibitor-1/YccA family protein [Bradyrhizobiaceae bacterium]|nr:Bax inhibitor-1/YccA family protein [Bradyrhizobiaceae bacterium]
MSNFDRNYAPFSGVASDRAVAYDMGLRAHMLRVYNYMTGGVALTGAIAWLTFQAAGGDAIRVVGRSITGLTPFGHAVFANPLLLLLLALAPLGVGYFIIFRIGQLQASTARLLFFVYAGTIGLSLATIFMVFTTTSITQVFFISAAAFGALSLYGYTTQRSLDAMGSFLTMGLFGLFIAMVVNIFLGSSMLQWLVSVAGVGIFAGLTAWNTQTIKELYDPMDDGTVAGRKAVMGALQLYIDFIAMFQFLLQLLGDRR